MNSIIASFDNKIKYRSLIKNLLYEELQIIYYTTLYI